MSYASILWCVGSSKTYVLVTLVPVYICHRKDLQRETSPTVSILIDVICVESWTATVLYWCIQRRSEHGLGLLSIDFLWFPHPDPPAGPLQMIQCGGTVQLYLYSPKAMYLLWSQGADQERTEIYSLQSFESVNIWKNFCYLCWIFPAADWMWGKSY